MCRETYLDPPDPEGRLDSSDPGAPTVLLETSPSQTNASSSFASAPPHECPDCDCVTLGSVLESVSKQLAGSESWGVVKGVLSSGARGQRQRKKPIPASSYAARRLGKRKLLIQRSRNSFVDEALQEDLVMGAASEEIRREENLVDNFADLENWIVPDSDMDEAEEAFPISDNDPLDYDSGPEDADEETEDEDP